MAVDMVVEADRTSYYVVLVGVSLGKLRHPYLRS